MSKHSARKVGKPQEQSLAYHAEAEARKMAREIAGSDGLWELFLTDAYRRVAGLDELDRKLSSSQSDLLNTPAKSAG